MKIPSDAPGKTPQRSGFLAKKSHRMDDFFQAVLGKCGKISGRWRLPEKNAGNLVYAFVGAAGGKHHRNEQLEGILVIQKSGNLRESFLQHGANDGRPTQCRR
jgi:hypothetical protein